MVPQRSWKSLSDVLYRETCIINHLCSFSFPSNIKYDIGLFTIVILHFIVKWLNFNSKAFWCSIVLPLRANALPRCSCTIFQKEEYKLFSNKHQNTSLTGWHPVLSSSGFIPCLKRSCVPSSVKRSTNTLYQYLQFFYNIFFNQPSPQLFRCKSVSLILLRPVGSAP